MSWLDRYPTVKIDESGGAVCDIDPSHGLQKCRDPGVYSCPWCMSLKVNPTEIMISKLKGGVNGP